VAAEDLEVYTGGFLIFLVVAGNQSSYHVPIMGDNSMITRGWRRLFV